MNSPQELESLDVLEARTQQVLVELKKKPIIADMLLELRTKLPKNLKYHGEEDENGLTHTEDALHDAILFAMADGIEDERSLELIGIESVYHDSGFLDQYSANEPFGAKRAVEAMRRYGGYTEEEMIVISDGIEATQVIMEGGILIQGAAPNRLSGYLLDADVSNFGRTDFKTKSEIVFKELQLQNPDKEMDKSAFLTSTYGFIKSHTWNTEAARRLRVPQQQVNIQNLATELGLVA